MVTWCKRHPIQFMALYLVFYLSFFTLLENSIVPTVILHCRLDDMIPFVKYAIIPYYLWFGWIVGTLFWQLYRAPKREFWRLCLPLFAGMTIALMICAVIPNGVNLRPAFIEGNDIFSQLVRGLWSADTSTNVCPSIHVFNSITLDLAYQRSSLLTGRKGRAVRLGARIMDISIILSTMLLKQHSVIDVACGIVLAVVVDRAAAAVAAALEQRPARLPAVEQPQAALERE
ncbi:MAG TPA: hypothetical protein H9915_07125 [Candidatus Gemmiger faecigallinarum]|nr:hypothetical protein [Candidatus Gemmiger faecigallinarum]